MIVRHLILCHSVEVCHLLHPICLKLVKHEIDVHVNARSIAVQNNRRGERVFSAV